MNYFIRNECGTCWHRNASSHNSLWVNIPPRLGFWTIYKAILMCYMGESGWDFHENKTKTSERQRKAIGSFFLGKNHCPGKFCLRGKLETPPVWQSSRKSFAAHTAPEEIAFWTKRNVTGRWHDSSKVWLSKSCWVQPSWRDADNEDKTDGINVGINKKILRLFPSEEESASSQILRVQIYMLILGLSQTNFKSQYGPSQLLERNGTKVVRGSQKPGDWRHWESKYAEVHGSEKIVFSQSLGG